MRHLSQSSALLNLQTPSLSDDDTVSTLSQVAMASPEKEEPAVHHALGKLCIRQDPPERVCPGAPPPSLHFAVPSSDWLAVKLSRTSDVLRQRQM